MRDGLAARHFALGTLDVDMDPVEIAGRMGKRINHLLIDLQPIAGAKFRAYITHQIGRILDCQHGRPFIVM